MRKLIFLAALIGGCGYSSLDNEMIGQVKKVNHYTPIICYDYTGADVSLGVMRNGVGSMSTQDVWVRVPERFEAVFREASDTGSLVKVKFNEYRVTFCIPEYEVIGIEILK